MDKDSPATFDDALSAPLGQRKAHTKLMLPRFVPLAVAALLGGGLAVFAGWISLVDDPLGGEPVAVVSVRADPSGDAAGRSGQPQRPDAKREPSREGAAQPVPQGAQTITIIDGSSGARQQVVIPGPGQPARPAEPAKPPAAAQESPRPAAGTPPRPAPNPAGPAKPAQAAAEPARPRMLDERLIEKSRHGLLPQISADGSRPATVYAHPQAAALAETEGPKIAIVIGKLGVSAQTTGAALSTLPATVTLAFNPHGSDLAQFIGRARSEGREVLLQIPMEPFDYPDNDPGPQTLLTSLPLDQNIDRLHWSMARTTGYLGLTNYMGARLATHDAAMTAIMLETGKRGLAYFEDGSLHSAAGKLAASRNIPFARADVVLDATPGASEIDAALARLEALARERGSAIGSASALPVSIERIAQWAKEASARGITLVPISAVMTKPPSS